MNFSLDWLHTGPIPTNAITGEYNGGMVVLSYLIATLASYVALDLFTKARAENKQASRYISLGGSAFVMGAGIWSTHLMAMLASNTSANIRFDIFWIAISLLTAIIVSWFALWLVSRRRKSFRMLILAGVLLGLGILSAFMFATQSVQAYLLVHTQFSLVTLALSFTIIVATLALWLSLKSTSGTAKKQFAIKALSAIVMGVAICGMHYIAMAATVISPSPGTISRLSITSYSLTFTVIGITTILFAIAVLVSAYKQLMANVVQNESNFLNAMLDNLEDGIVACDSDGKITLINSALRKIFKINELPQHASQLQEYINFISKDNTPIDHINSPLSRALNGEYLRGKKWRIKLQDGTLRNIVIKGKPIINHDGKRLGAVVVINDETERLRMENIKNEFISTVSHELRTPLTSIRGSLGLILGGTTGDLPIKTKNLLEIAHNNCERLIRLINDILDIEKIEAGKMTFIMKVTSIDEILQTALETNQGLSEKYNVPIVLKGETHDIKVNVDKDRLIQVITNLISNAMKFSPPGSNVTVCADIVQDKIKVAISDQGKGISTKFQKHIFEKFAQADSSSVRQQGGTGLGLSISKAIIERMGGQINFVSSEKVGTTFYFELPIYKEQINQKSHITSQSRILICEDDKDVANLLSIILAENDFSTDIAYSIAQAKKMLQNNHYDAMTLDLILPDGDGISLVRDLRAQHEQIPIIIITGKIEGKEDLLNSDAINILDWLNKPIDANQLNNVIRHIKKRLRTGKPSLLHIEDDSDLKKIVAKMLEKEVQLKAASTLNEAEDILSKENFDLVLLDLILPDGSGMELLPKLCKQHIPVVVFSAFDLPKDYIQFVEAALTKSRTSDSELLAAIKAAIKVEEDDAHNT